VEALKGYYIEYEGQWRVQYYRRRDL